jgi:hypothetical protein
VQATGRTKITHEGHEGHEGHEEVQESLKRSLEFLFIGQLLGVEKTATSLAVDDFLMGHEPVRFLHWLTGGGDCLQPARGSCHWSRH